MNIGRAVREVRGLRNLTQRELAFGADLDPSYVSLIESGRRMPSLEVLSRIADVVSVPIYIMVLLGCEDHDYTLRGDRERARTLLRNLPAGHEASVGLLRAS